MENVVLYRKYRPQGFEEIIGQTHIVQTLKNAILANAISHAYLFTGPRGSGKTTMARLFAKAINCAKPHAKNGSCNTCDACIEIMAGKSLDLIEIDAASHTGVDEVRELIDGLKFAPVKSQYKIFIIDECHQLSKSAANALLKTLEEPPAHAIFILATTEANKMIPTIVSRCQRFDFKRLQISEIIQKLEFILKKEEITFDDAALPLVALNARGSFRDAESLLDKCIHFTGSGKKLTAQSIKEILGIVDVSQISGFMDFLLQKKTKEAVLQLGSMMDGGVDLGEFAKTLVFYTRQMLLQKINPEFLTIESSGFAKEEIENVNRQIAATTQAQLQTMLRQFIEAEQKMKYSSILQLPLELAVIELTAQ